MTDESILNSEEVAPADFPAVSVSGDFVDRVESVSSVNLSTVTTIGSLDDQQLLLSFVDWSITTDNETEARLITFENLAYVLSKMARDYARVCGEVRQLSSGTFGAEEGRMEYVSRLLEETIESLEKAKVNLSI